MYQDMYFGQDLRQNSVGDIDMVSGNDALKQSIVIRLSTPKGSNIFNPLYGNGLYDILSDGIDDEWLSFATEHIQECIEQDTNIQVVKITPYVDYEGRRVTFDISYRDNQNINNILWGESIE